MNAIVTSTITVRRRRGLIMSDASQPWNWYVTAVTIRKNAASSGGTASRAGPRPMIRATPSASMAGRNRTMLSSAAS